MAGLCATIALREVPNCPVTNASTTIETPINSVVRSSPADPETPPVEEFTVETTDENTLERDEFEVDLETVATGEQSETYRFTREGGTNCPCEIVEREGTPVTSIRANDGALVVTIRVTDLESMSEIVKSLQTQYDDVHLRELVRTGEETTTDLIYIDRNRFTERQREVLETAHEMGYFEYPKRANAGEVANRLGISRSTFIEHLAAGQTKILNSLLES